MPPAPVQGLSSPVLACLACRGRLRLSTNSLLAAQFGCALGDGPFGLIIRTGTAKLTAAPDVYAAGDAACVPHGAHWVSADGATASVSLHRSLVFNA
jgi:thioredoxin reductase